MAKGKLQQGYKTYFFTILNTLPKIQKNKTFTQNSEYRRISNTKSPFSNLPSFSPHPFRYTRTQILLTLHGSAQEFCGDTQQDLDLIVCSLQNSTEGGAISFFSHSESRRTTRGGEYGGLGLFFPHAEDLWGCFCWLILIEESGFSLFCWPLMHRDCFLIFG